MMETEADGAVTAEAADTARAKSTQSSARSAARIPPCLSSRLATGRCTAKIVFARCATSAAIPAEDFADGNLSESKIPQMRDFWFFQKERVMLFLYKSGYCYIKIKN